MSSFFGHSRIHDHLNGRLLDHIPNKLKGRIDAAPNHNLRLLNLLPYIWLLCTNRHLHLRLFDDRPNCLASRWVSRLIGKRKAIDFAHYQLAVCQIKLYFLFGFFGLGIFASIAIHHVGRSMVNPYLRFLFVDVNATILCDLFREDDWVSEVHDHCFDFSNAQTAVSVLLLPLAKTAWGVMVVGGVMLGHHCFVGLGWRRNPHGLGSCVGDVRFLVVLEGWRRRESHREGGRSVLHVIAIPISWKFVGIGLRLHTVSHDKYNIKM